MMLIDLTWQLIEAKKHQLEWENSIFRTLYDKLANLSGYAIDWDDSVPENWVGVFNRDRSIGYASIYTRFPFVITSTKHELVARTIIDQSNLLWIVTEDYHKESYKIDESLYQQIFPRWVSDVVVPQQFSIGQLVYATMT